MSQNPSQTTSENDQDRTNLITPAGYRALTGELTFLKMTERPRIVEEVHFAAKQGDRSENAEYQYGKKRLREIDRRMRFLTKRIESARIIEPALQNPDQIRFGATVVLMDENEVQRTYQIVGEDESDLKVRKISWKSPLARALLGAKKGHVVSVKAPKGDVDYEVLDYHYAPSDGQGNSASSTGHLAPTAAEAVSTNSVSSDVASPTRGSQHDR